MTLGQIAGLIAALAAVVLVALCAVPLLKLGGVLDEVRKAVCDVDESTVPILEELKKHRRHNQWRDFQTRSGDRGHPHHFWAWHHRYWPGRRAGPNLYPDRRDADGQGCGLW